MAFNFVYNNQPFTIWMRHPMDVAVLREIYLDKEYEWCPIEDPKVIIDLGAHFGDTAVYYHTRFPQARIIAVEPAPESYARLVQNTKNIPEITTVQAAIGGSDGSITLHLVPSSLGHSVVVRSQTHDSVEVPQLLLSSLLQKVGVTNVDLIKFDIEGAEFAVFESAGATTTAQAYIGEVHEDLGGKSILDFKQMFTTHHIDSEQLPNTKRFIVKIN